jgi:hypothetical protein
MNKKTGRTKSFYKERVGQENPSESVTKKPASTKTVGLSEDQLVKLSDDLRRPITDSPSVTNPMQ